MHFSKRDCWHRPGVISFFKKKGPSLTVDNFRALNSSLSENDVVKKKTFYYVLLKAFMGQRKKKKKGIPITDLLNEINKVFLNF